MFQNIVGMEIRLLALLLCVSLPIVSQPGVAEITALRRQADAALRAGQLAEAERAARSLIALTPRDAEAIGFLATVLDAQLRFAEADTLFTQAAALGPPSLAFMNNLGAHYLATGRKEMARVTFDRVIAQSPANVNARLQLARLALQERQGARALEHLHAIAESARLALPVRLLTVEAYYLVGDTRAAERLVDSVDRELSGDPREAYALAMALAKMGRYERAETLFRRVVETVPTDFATLYNLGLAAAKAGHYERARSALTSALEQRPGDPDCMLNLGQVYAALKQDTRAAELLVQAGQVAPGRADIPLALAHILEKAGLYGDAALAYDRHVVLRPDDAEARRDRALALANSGQSDKASAELEWYIQKQPKDPFGHYYLALVLQSTDANGARRHLTEALRVKPDLSQASLLRAGLLRDSGDLAAALAELRLALSRNPKDAELLEQLGVTYLALERPAEAEKALRSAWALAPDRDTIALSLGRTLMHLGRGEEARHALADFERLRKNRPQLTQVTGALEMLRLPPEQRQTRSIELLAQALVNRPNDASLHLELGRRCLATGRLDQARQAFLDLLALGPDAPTSLAAGKSLLNAGQPELALPFFERAADQEPSARLGTALARAQLKQPAAGLAELENVPENARTPEYQMIRGLLLANSGRRDEAVQALELGFEAGKERPELALEAARLLVVFGHKPKALRLLERVADPGAEVQLARAWLLAELGQSRQAREALRRIELSQPEWSRFYILKGLLLERENKTVDAIRALETSVALGGKQPWLLARLSRLRTQARRAVEAGPNGQARDEGEPGEEAVLEILFSAP